MKGSCLWCENPLPKRRSKYCSDPCGYQYWMKYIAPLWWPNAKTMALQRANHKCEKCTKRGNLEVHHIVPLGQDDMRHKSEKNDQANLRVLCRKCHEKVHHPNAYVLVGKIPEEQMKLNLVI